MESSCGHCCWCILKRVNNWNELTKRTDRGLLKATTITDGDDDNDEGRTMTDGDDDNDDGRTITDGNDDNDDGRTIVTAATKA